MLVPLPPDHQDQQFERIAQALNSCGWIVLPDAIPLHLSAALLSRVIELGDDVFHDAGTGRMKEHSVNTFVRRDRIKWLENEHPAEGAWLAYMEALRVYLNKTLFLGLFSYESHFAHYKPGDFYKKHVDAFKGQANRRLTTVLYLNSNWESSDGGELLLYKPDDQLVELAKVLPRFATLAIFLSEDFPHEVLPARRDRYSIAGWYRLNSSSAQQVDPPR